MADRGDANRLLGIGQLVEDSVRADPQRVQTAQFASERMAGLWLALQQTQCVLDRVDQRPFEFEQFPPCATGKNEPCQRSASVGSTLGKLTAKFRQGDRFVALDLAEASLQSSEGGGVGKDLCGLL